MSLRRNKKQTGAVRRQPAKQSNWRGAVLRWCKRLLVTTLSLVVLAGFGYATQWLLAKPVNTVGIDGELKYIDRQQVIEVIRPHLLAGFVRVDLQEIQQELQNIPWVKEVSLRRQWPDRLEVRVTEQQPIAYWGDDGFLSQSGEIFRPQNMVELAQLPRLYAADEQAAAVIEHYRLLADLLREQGLQLNQLELDQQLSWQATINQRIRLVLGKDRVMKKMQRFLTVYRQQLQQRMEQIDTIDMRYSNGVAVRWTDRALQG